MYRAEEKSTILRQKPITDHGSNGLLIKVYLRPVTKFSVAFVI